jgi:SET domain-containing protein
MLLVRTRLGVSEIDGIGLFADENIARGAIIWRFDPSIDQRFSEDMLPRLSLGAREQIEKYSYREKHSGLYVLCGDDARFFNHSTEPNCIDIYEDAANPDDAHDVTLALRDIAKGEELTCDYSLFDQDLLDGKYHLPMRERPIAVPAWTC